MRYGQLIASVQGSFGNFVLHFRFPIALGNHLAFGTRETFDKIFEIFRPAQTYGLLVLLCTALISSINAALEILLMSPAFYRQPLKLGMCNLSSFFILYTRRRRNCMNIET